MIRKIFSPAVLVSAVLIFGIGLIVYRGFFSSTVKAPGEFVIPEFSQAALAGKVVFDKNCAECHGENAAGSKKGPPLIHDIYNPGHHSDAAFHRATRQGTPQHHWAFGNMPPQRQVSKEQVNRILRYIRELQTANGINYRPHRM